MAEARGVIRYNTVLILEMLPERHRQDPNYMFEILVRAPMFASGQNHAVSCKPCSVPRRRVKGTESLCAASGVVTCAGGVCCCQPAHPCPSRRAGSGGSLQFAALQPAQELPK